MCFDHDALPPDLPPHLALPPIAGGAPGERVTVTSADGTELSAFVATSGAEPAERPGVVIMPDVRGLYRFYEDLAEKFAAAGHPAVAYDFFGRTAGLGPRDDDFDFWPEIAKTTPEQIRADAAAAGAELVKEAGDRPLVVIGFCFGGMQAYLAAANASEVPGLAGVVGFYGALNGERFGLPSAKDEIAKTTVPVLGLFGGADEAIPPDQVQTFTENLQASGVEHTVHSYDGAPHSFFDRKQEEFAEASADAWTRTLAFLQP